MFVLNRKVSSNMGPTIGPARPVPNNNLRNAQPEPAILMIPRGSRAQAGIRSRRRRLEELRRSLSRALHCALSALQTIEEASATAFSATRAWSVDSNWTCTVLIA